MNREARIYDIYILLIDHEHVGWQIGHYFIWLRADAFQKHVIKVANKFGARVREDKRVAEQKPLDRDYANGEAARDEQ